MEAQKARRLELWRRQPSEHDQDRKQMPNTPLATHQHARRTTMRTQGGLRLFPELHALELGVEPQIFACRVEAAGHPDLDSASAYVSHILLRSTRRCT